MRAAVITRFGGPEVLEVRTVPDPSVGDHEVLVAVHTAGVNRADLLQRLGRYPAPAGSPVDIPGMEFAGEVVASGARVTRWRAGDRVFGIVGGGAQAELVATHEDAIVAIPDSLSWNEAGAVPEAFITAHDAMIIQAGLVAGEHVLVHAVGSAVGIAAVQLARNWNAIPHGTTRTAEKLSRAREHGLESGVVVGDRLEAIREACREWSNGTGIPVILDLVGGGYLSESVHCAAPRGRIMLIGTMAGASAELPLGLVLRNRLLIRGTVLRARSLPEKIEATRTFERDVVPFLADRSIRPVVDSVFPLTEISQAHGRMASNETYGKIVLQIS